MTSLDAGTSTSNISSAARVSSGVRHMKSQRSSKVVESLAAAMLALTALTSGCATVFVRSENTVHSQHVFPATSFDAQFLWHNGLKGEPLFATTDPNERNGPPARIAYTLGAVVDFPFSVAFDTILVPVDLIQCRAPADSRDNKGDQTVQPTGASRLAQRRIERQRRLAPVANL